MNTHKKWLGAGVVALATALSFTVLQVVAQTDPGNQPGRQPTGQPGGQPGDHPGMDRGQQNTEAGKTVTLTGKLIDLHCYMTGAKDDAMKGAHESGMSGDRTSGMDADKTRGTGNDPHAGNTQGADADKDRTPGADRDRTSGADKDRTGPGETGMAGADPHKSGDMKATGQSKSAQCIRNGSPCALETSSGLVILGKGEKNNANDLAQHASKQITVRGKLFTKGGLQYLEIESVEPQVAQGNTPRDTPRSGVNPH